jgi:hypothetical protein
MRVATSIVRAGEPITEKTFRALKHRAIRVSGTTT